MQRIKKVKIFCLLCKKTIDFKTKLWYNLLQKDKRNTNKGETTMMTTKEKERQALEQIRKIVEDLGEGSYVAAAFDGCFELAESNIRNDVLGSWKEACVRNAQDAEELADRIDGICFTVKQAKMVKFLVKDALIDAVQQADNLKHEIFGYILNGDTEDKKASAEEDYRFVDMRINNLRRIIEKLNKMIELDR